MRAPVVGRARARGQVSKSSLFLRSLVTTIVVIVLLIISLSIIYSAQVAKVPPRVAAPRGGGVVRAVRVSLAPSRALCCAL